MKFTWKLLKSRILSLLKKKKCNVKIEKNNNFNDSLYTRHFLYPLISLYPMQLDLHWLMMFIQKADSPDLHVWKHFEELAEKRPGWPFGESDDDIVPERVLYSLLEYINFYKAKCISHPKITMSSDENICGAPLFRWGCGENDDKQKTIENGELPFKTFPSAYEIFNHQLQWLEVLKIGREDEARDNLKFLRNVVKQTLYRLFQTRNLGEKNDFNEIIDQDLSMNSELVDHRINRFCDYILEEIEEICQGITEPFPKIQIRVDNAQRYIKNGMNLLKQLDKERQELFVPLLANVVVFLESMDRIIHRFHLDEADSPEVPEEMLFLLKLPVEKQEDESWYQAFIEFKNSINGKIPNENPEIFFQSPYWSYTALGPRILGELYIGAINHSVKEFEFYKSSLYFDKLKSSYNRRLSIFQKISLFWKRSEKELRKLTGLKVNPFNLSKAYRAHFRLPFMLKISFGAGLIVIAELDYGMWSDKISQNAKWPNLIVFLLFTSSLAGTFSLISGKKRVKRSLGLFMRLVAAAFIPSVLSTIIFGNYFKLLDLSFLFLIFGSIFFAVIVNTIGNDRK